MTLDQALKEGDEALEIYSRTPRGSVLVHEDALRALLAVAKAAVEMREAQAFYFGRHSIESDADHGSTRLADATAAFDAAVRGEGKEKEG